MKKIFLAFCCGAGGSMIGFWASELDTTIGCILFTFGVILLTGSIAAISKEEKNDKSPKD